MFDDLQLRRLANGSALSGGAAHPSSIAGCRYLLPSQILVIKEGDPVHRMVFVVWGQLWSSQSLSRGMVATCMLGPGNFLGDVLLSWCLRCPFIDRLPPSSAAFVYVEATEDLGLGALHLRYITKHFRYKFTCEGLKRTAKYYSSNWRT